MYRKKKVPVRMERERKEKFLTYPTWKNLLAWPSSARFRVACHRFSNPLPLRYRSRAPKRYCNIILYAERLAATIIHVGGGSLDRCVRPKSKPRTEIFLSVDIKTRHKGNEPFDGHVVPRSSEVVSFGNTDQPCFSVPQWERRLFIERQSEDQGYLNFIVSNKEAETFNYFRNNKVGREKTYLTSYYINEK